jgi:hypothetical protein
LREVGGIIREQENRGIAEEMFSEQDNSVNEGNKETKPLREYKFSDPA